MPLKVARHVILHEAKSLEAMSRRLGHSFTQAVTLLKRTRGRVVVMGMGKPFFVAQKLSASLASTGVPSIFLHPADAVHGDIGRVTRKDVLIAFSNSGETEEIVRLLPIVKTLGCKLIAITGNLRSQLAKASDVCLDVGVQKETEPLNVVPTASIACMLAMGDALTMALIKKRNFKEEDFAFFHPGGDLGRRLHMTAGMAMRRHKLIARVSAGTSMRQTLLKITACRSGAAAVVDPKGKLIGIFTDGDLRRRFKTVVSDLNQPVQKFMTAKPLTIYENERASSALEIMRKRRIDELPVVDRRFRLKGILDVQDLIAKGFIV